MGSNISMDVSAVLTTEATAVMSTTAATGSSPLLLPMLTPTPELHAPASSQDKFRLDTLLIPEDLVDIHIEADASSLDEAATATATATVPDVASSVANNTRHGKYRKRNVKKKQNPDGSGEHATATATSVPFQTERTIEQRREQVRPIIDKLTELQMNISYPAIRELYKQLNHFVKTGEDSKIKISFPEFDRRIKGELTNAVYKPCWVKLEMN